MLTMYEQITIQTLHKQGVKKSQIAKQLGCHRNTIRKILRRNRLIERQTRLKSSVFDRCKEQIKTWLDQKVTKLRIHEKLQEEYGIHSTYVNLGRPNWRLAAEQGISTVNRGGDTRGIPLRCAVVARRVMATAQGLRGAVLAPRSRRRALC